MEQNEGKLLWTETRLNKRMAGSREPDSFMQIRRRLFAKCQLDFWVCNVVIQQMGEEANDYEGNFSDQILGKHECPWEPKEEFALSMLPIVASEKGLPNGIFNNLHLPWHFFSRKHYSYFLYAVFLLFRLPFCGDLCLWAFLLDFINGMGPSNTDFLSLSKVLKYSGYV